MKRESSIQHVQKLLFIAPAMLLLLLLTGYPLLRVIQMSFYDYRNKSTPIFNGIVNYISVLQDTLFWRSLGHTLLFTFGTVVLDVMIGLLLAALLNQKMNLKIRGVFRALFMFPWLFSSSVVASAWVLMLNPFGVINWILLNVGFADLSHIAWLSDERLSMLCLILANVWRSFPFAMLMLLAGLQTVPQDVQEAAEVDGAGRVQRFIFVVIPQIKGMIFTVSILEIIWNFRAFDLIFLMTGGGPMNATEVLSTYIYNHAFRSLDFGFASATAIFMLLIMVLTSSLYLRMALSKEGK